MVEEITNRVVKVNRFKLMVSIRIVHLGRNPMVGGKPIVDRIKIEKLIFSVVDFVEIWFIQRILFFFM